MEIDSTPKRKIIRKKVAAAPVPEAPKKRVPQKKVARAEIPGQTEIAQAIAEDIASLATEASDVPMAFDPTLSVVALAPQQCALVCLSTAGTEAIVVDFHGIKMEVFPCVGHLAELLTTASRESDRGLCHVCATPIAETYWQHEGPGHENKRCHGRCVCEDVTEGKTRVYFQEAAGEDINSLHEKFAPETSSFGTMTAEPRIVR